ncbi:hypothetical protein SBV1_1850008 [Verrucomicrobia bacterium]|nr:hypothetical protein SBV1_1850008 [Verrucomicrobiota bacterium]
MNQRAMPRHRQGVCSRWLEIGRRSSRPACTWHSRTTKRRHSPGEPSPERPQPEPFEFAGRVPSLCSKRSPSTFAGRTRMHMTCFTCFEITAGTYQTSRRTCVLCFRTRARQRHWNTCEPIFRIPRRVGQGAWQNSYTAGLIKQPRLMPLASFGNSWRSVTGEIHYSTVDPLSVELPPFPTRDCIGINVDAHWPSWRGLLRSCRRSFCGRAWRGLGALAGGSRRSAWHFPV